MKLRSAFTLLELVFVIVIMGIIGKFGVEFLAQAYKSFIFSNVNNSLQANSATAVEQISMRLQYRIKDSIIARTSDIGNFATNFVALEGASGENYTVLEWVGTDIEGFRGNSASAPNLPNWSGVIDLDLSTQTKIFSPETNTTKIDDMIDILSYGNSTIDDAALYFVGSSSDVMSGYGWNGTAISDQNQTMHPINDVVGQPTQFVSATGLADGNFSEIYEYYQLAWTAYSVVMEDYNSTGNETGNLVLHYDYQPWNGDKYSDAQTKKELIMQNVSSFQFMAIGSLVKIQVCTKSDLVEAYSLCKEKTIY